MVFCKEQLDPVRAINIVYNLPIIEPAIHYLHGAAGLPTKATWMQAIHNRNYLTSPLVNVKNVNNIFPELEDNQKGHMRTQCQCVRYTKAMA